MSIAYRRTGLATIYPNRWHTLKYFNKLQQVTMDDDTSESSRARNAPIQTGFAILKWDMASK